MYWNFCKAARSSSKGSSPAHGDGLTFDHLMDREELWFDFCADTGDGGNSTYTVARALATPQLKVMRPTVKGEEQVGFILLLCGAVSAHSEMKSEV